MKSRKKRYKLTCLQNRLIDFENKLMVARGKGSGEEIVWQFRIEMYLLLYLKCITNNDLLYGIESSDSMLWGNLDGATKYSTPPTPLT